MGVMIAPESELGKELAKWNTPRNKAILDSNGEPILDAAGRQIMGMGAIGFEPYPKAMYRAKARANGKVHVLEGEPQPYDYAEPRFYERDCLRVTAENAQCFRKVHTPEEEKRARDEGWRPTQGEALAHYEGLQQDIAQAAAENAASVRRMSAKAQTEHAAAENETSKHVVDVVRGPRRGRKRTTAVAGTGPIEA